MKAKYIKRIRASMREYLVVRSHGLFGDFKKEWSNRFSDDLGLHHGTSVWSTDPLTAVQKFVKRKNLHDNPDHETNPKFGKFRVVPKSKPFTRHVKYYN